MVRLGTKWPSITSMWSQSVPRVISSTASESPPKSAERIDGATRRDGCGGVGSIGREPIGATVPQRADRPGQLAATVRPSTGSAAQDLAGLGAHAVTPVRGAHGPLALRLPGDRPDPMAVAGHPL